MQLIVSLSILSPARDPLFVLYVVVMSIAVIYKCNCNNVFESFL